MKKIIYLFIVFAILFSCRKKIEFPKWEVNALFPIATTSLNISKLVKDSALKTNPDQSLSIVYSGEVYKIDFDTLFLIPDTVIDTSYACPLCAFLPFVPSNASLISDTAQETKYSLNSVELAEVILRSGTVEIEITSDFKGKTLLSYKMPLTTDINGNSIFFSDTVPAASEGNPSFIFKSYDLKDYKINLKGKKGNSFNTVSSNFTAITLEQTVVKATDSVKILHRFKNIVPEYARGYFGKTALISEPVNTAVKKLSNLIGGNFDLKYFDLTLKIQNGVGVDIRFLLDEIVSKNISSGSNVSLVSSVVGSAININRASINSSLSYPPIVYSEYVINLNNSNSNADELIEIFPDSISASSQITLNPLGNISNNNDFVYYGNGINISLDAEVPLCFSANNLILSDTLSINFQPDSADSATKKISGGNLILNCYNGYPFSAKSQLFLMNENYSIYETLVSGGEIIEAAELDANFKATEKRFSQIFIPLNQERIEKLKTAKNLYVKLFFSTASQPNYVKIYSDYSIELKLVADIDYEMSEF